MISFSDPHKTLVGLHDMLTGWQYPRAESYAVFAAGSGGEPVTAGVDALRSGHRGTT